MYLNEGWRITDRATHKRKTSMSYLKKTKTKTHQLNKRQK